MTKALFRYLGPSGVLLGSFGGLILLGTALLDLPFMQGPKPISILDCFFTATSAVCVTGLITVDTASAWSPWGQGLILALLQLGGLGIMTFSVALLMLAGKSPGLTSHRALTGSLAQAPPREMRLLVRRVLVYSLALEAAGALVLTLRFMAGHSLPRALALGCFHSISAFCNAGFSLFGDSLAAYSGDLTVNLTIMALVILGGLGFVVLRELDRRLRPGGNKPRKRWPLHTQIVLITSGLLLLGGGVFFWLSQGLSGGGWTDSLLPALFTSVTARTAGFNTIAMNQLTNPALLLVMLLMFIGASPGSTGGGIKTTTLATLYALARGRLAGSSQARVRGRTVSLDQVAEALTLLLGAGLVLTIGALLLVATESAGMGYQHDRGSVLIYVFEAVSAFGTVGLSMGATPNLTPAGKIIVIILMFVGRLGPLTFIYALAQKRRKTAYRPATEKIMLG